MKETNEKLNGLIVDCVRQDVEFRGLTGARYSIQDVLAGRLTLDTINGFCDSLEREIAKLPTRDRFNREENKNERLRSLLELKLSALTEAGVYLVQKAKAEAEAEAVKATLQKELETLQRLQKRQDLKGLETNPDALAERMEELKQKLETV